MADRLAIMPTRRNTLAEPIISTHREKVDKYREKIKYWLRCQLISRRDRYRIGKRITGWGSAGVYWCCAPSPRELSCFRNQ